MRSNSNTAATTKAILKVLQEHVGPELVSQVIIIKSDNFWHKQRAAITSSHKYKFEVILSNLDSLAQMKMTFIMIIYVDFIDFYRGTTEVYRCNAGDIRI